MKAGGETKKWPVIVSEVKTGPTHNNVYGPYIMAAYITQWKKWLHVHTRAGTVLFPSRTHLVSFVAQCPRSAVTSARVII